MLRQPINAASSIDWKLNGMKALENILANGVLLQMPQVIDWIESYGLRSLNTRYTRYVKYIDDFFDMDVKMLLTESGEKRFNVMSKAMSECHYIFIIYSVFKNEKSVGFKERLSKVITDPDLLEHNQESTARNFLFELLTAAYFSDSGYDIDFDSNSDVLAMKNGSTFYIECKKLISQKKLLEKIKRAGKKLENDVPENDGSHGLIFVDVSNLIFQDIPQHEVNDKQEAANYLALAMDNLLTCEVKANIENLNERFKDKSLGICFIGYASIWTQDVTLYFLTDMRVIARGTMNETQREILKNTLSSCDGAFFDIFK